MMIVKPGFDALIWPWGSGIVIGQRGASYIGCMLSLAARVYYQTESKQYFKLELTTTLQILGTISSFIH